jgi:hypothetical protein
MGVEVARDAKHPRVDAIASLGRLGEEPFKEVGKRHGAQRKSPAAPGSKIGV